MYLILALILSGIIGIKLGGEKLRGIQYDREREARVNFENQKKNELKKYTIGERIECMNTYGVFYGNPRLKNFVKNTFGFKADFVMNIEKAVSYADDGIILDELLSGGFTTPQRDYKHPNSIKCYKEDYVALVKFVKWYQDKINSINNTNFKMVFFKLKEGRYDYRTGVYVDNMIKNGYEINDGIFCFEGIIGYSYLSPTSYKC